MSAFRGAEDTLCHCCCPRAHEATNKEHGGMSYGADHVVNASPNEDTNPKPWTQNLQLLIVRALHSRQCCAPRCAARYVSARKRRTLNDARQLCKAVFPALLWLSLCTRLLNALRCPCWISAKVCVLREAQDKETCDPLGPPPQTLNPKPLNPKH